MHFLGISVWFAFSALLYANLAFQSSHEYYDYEQEEGDDGMEPSEPDLEEQLRSAGSVDELMRLLYPSYWNMLKCHSKRAINPRSSHRDPDTRSEELSFAAAYFNLDIFKSIEAEWRKTLCMPREVCLDVGKEFGAATNTFFKPPCVSVYRCGGCCNSEELQCMNISTSFISKTLFEITVPVKQPPKPVTISFANHTSCSCLSKLDVYRQKHSIIRRALPECHVANKTCPKNQSWSNGLCRCVSLHDTLFPSSTRTLSSRISVAPTKSWTRRRVDPRSCGPHHTFNKDTCQCSCNKVCPSTHPLNRTKCACECNESHNKCFLRGRRFQPATCSCYRLPCPGDPRKRECEEGFYFSEEVCHCIPNYWRRLD
ncbi:hypothetical protein PHYPO_G00174580 [Pangasianodon hypophthalmus]|uniref:Vascular endothelial growth factor C n=1 Tax=Pangasianodon hypophthalmus TaxID=310915 RepID=A0A5N5PQH5_PANHP|nr:hypothetical protein PHYPO_G00174580 [Pangasianodon hypophthalmus]